jgi:cation-transporting ATPase I
MAAAQAPHVIRRAPGRVRIHAPVVSEIGSARVGEQLEQLEGVLRVRASALTGNVLVEFDSGRVGEAELLLRLQGIEARAESDPGQRGETTSDPGRRARHPWRKAPGPPTRRARIAVRGLDRDPDLARRLIERLGRKPGVTRVSPSPLTGRVLVEAVAGEHLLQEVLDEIADLELPADGEQEIPAHPLDPGPIIESGANTLGAGLGLIMLLGRRLTGSEGPPVSQGAGEIAGTVGLIDGIPALSGRLEDALGQERKKLALGATAVLTMSASGNPIGLAFAGAAALRVLTESLARRRAWRDYELRTAEHPDAHPGAVLSVAPGERVPLMARVIDGFGTALALDGTLQPLLPGAPVDPGARIHGGEITVELGAEPVFEPALEASQPRPDALARYEGAISYAALAYALATGLVTRSPARLLTALLLVNPTPALAGRGSADRGASARVIRAGVGVVGSRPNRAISLPDVLVVDEPRTVFSGSELVSGRSLAEGYDQQEVIALAAAVSMCADSPWGVRLPLSRDLSAVDGTFDGRVASAEVAGERWLLAPADDESSWRLQGDEHGLALRRQRDGLLAGLIVLRPRLSPGAEPLIEACRAHGVQIELATATPNSLTRRLADRCGVSMAPAPAVEEICRQQASGMRVAVVGDSVRSAAAFDRADLAIAVTSGVSGRFPARADLLAPTLETVAAVLDAGARRDAAVRDAVLISAAANLAGAAWGIWRPPPFSSGNRPAHVGGLAAMAVGAARLWGGRRSRTVTERLSDPVPERWGRQSVEDVLRHLRTTREGLTHEQAQARWQAWPQLDQASGLADMLSEQLSSPLVGVLGLGAAMSVAMGALGDVAMIASVIVANAAVGVWQENRAQTASRALRDMGARSARVLRNGRPEIVGSDALVPGDVILLASGDRVPADARVISTDAFEVDEAALTGESVPVLKAAAAAGERSRVVLEGTDVVTGAASAVVVAVGEDTRMGAIAAALAQDSGAEQSPLDQRLGAMLVRGLPWVAAGGLIVTVAGVLRGQAALAQLALGASVAIAAVPEGLPLLAGVAEAAVAQRLASRNALVTRLSAVEALGRVDVACVDKTGTLTTGRLELTTVAGPRRGQADSSHLTPGLRDVLRAAAIASPSPDAPDAAAHPTDVAILRGAQRAAVNHGLGARQAESPFDPARSFHATLADGALYVKGAAEVLAERCTQVRQDGADEPLDDPGRAALLERAASLAGQGLRVLLVAEGAADASVEDPRELTALGFVGISDPPREGVAEAVRRCREAGVRVVMITGDHPATAVAIASEIGLPAHPDCLLTGEELSGEDHQTLSKRLEQATIIARTTPLQKLRIVEALRDAGHVVAMTGDGVNDAPALRLADVGVAMGRGGTEVARQTADLVLSDDEFSTLAEALVEGRGFWHNMRRALGLLLGGNLGEVGVMIGAAVFGLPAPLTTRQVLTVNLVTDVFPAVSVAIQPPEHRNLSEFSREGGAALDAPLRADVLRRGIATALPTLGACLLAWRTLSREAAGSVAYMSIVTTQLAQTVDLGWAEGRLTPQVLAAAGGSLAALAATFALPPVRMFLGLAPPTVGGAMLVAAASGAAVVLARKLPIDSVAPDSGDPHDPVAAIAPATPARANDYAL